MDCRAAVITGIESELEIVTVPIPELEPGAVLIRVDAATLCGTDAHRWQGHIASREHPFVPGHETCGTIVDMRGPVRSLLNEPLAVGDRVISSYAHCGHCFFCRISRQTSLCEDVINYGVWHPERLLGGCAEYHIFSAQTSLIKVPDNVPSPLAASAACALRTVIHGFEQLGAIETHETLLVLGSGPLGLYTAAVARDRGAKSVYVIGAPAARLDVARAFGADDVLNILETPARQDRVAWVKERTGGRGADIVFNCANAEAFIESLDMCRRGGRTVSIGHSSGPDIALNPDKLFDQIAIHTVAMAEARHFYEAVTFLSTRIDRFPFANMLSNSYPLERTTDAIRGMAEFREVKPVILPHAKAM